MSRLFGPVRQNGYVVTDLDAAIRGWLDIGIGPWTVYPHVTLDDFVHRSTPADPDISIALSYSGSLQIELIALHDETPSLYREFLDRCPEGGLQHVGFHVDDFTSARAKAIDELGWTVGQEGSVGGGAFVYFDTEHHPGTVAELIAMNDGRRRAFERLEQMSVEWDGIEQPVIGHAR